MITAHQWDSCVAQCVNAGADRQRRTGVERRVAIRVDAQLRDRVERTVAAREPDDGVLTIDGLEPRVAALALDQPSDVLIHHLAAYLPGDGLDELLPGQDSCDVPVVEDTRYAWQAKRGTGNDNRLGEVFVPRRPRDPRGRWWCDSRRLLKDVTAEVE